MWHVCFSGVLAIGRKEVNVCICVVYFVFLCECDFTSLLHWTHTKKKEERSCFFPDCMRASPRALQSPHGRFFSFTGHCYAPPVCPFTTSMKSSAFMPSFSGVSVREILTPSNI